MIRFLHLNIFQSYFLPSPNLCLKIIILFIFESNAGRKVTLGGPRAWDQFTANTRLHDNQTSSRHKNIAYYKSVQKWPKLKISKFATKSMFHTTILKKIFRCFIHSVPVNRTPVNGTDGVPRYPDSTVNGCPVNRNRVHKIHWPDSPLTG